jgi:hypothetical protein
LARALGATPEQVSLGLSAAQVLPALAGAILGIPGGLALLAAADPDSTTTMPPLWQLLAVVPGTVLVVAGQWWCRRWGIVAMVDRAVCAS